LIDGLPEFVKGAQTLVLGAESDAVQDGRVVSTQTLSGTGALSLGFEVIAKYLPRAIYVSKPTWGNHHGIIQKVGLPLREYNYYDAKTKSLDFDGLIESLKNATPGSAILLHVCAHNPTGVDPSQEQWKKICEVMKTNSLIPFFDSAYQGFASGSLEKDIWPVRYFLK
jgi:aspartate aminotransferase, cytoplasmic